ncbi:MAG: M23 family metallopeptidase [Actinomycetota bacterium]|nr:M23 family metallopeptidase [Actinomycetota bacterium]
MNSPLVGFLRINRSVLAITAIAFVVAAVGIHDLPAQAATQRVRVEIPGQRLAVATAPISDADTAVSSKRDAFGVTTFSMVEWPIDPGSPVGDRFGNRTPPCAGCSSFHRGTDFNPGLGTPIGAIADGVVTEIGNPSGELGVYAIVQHTIDGVVVSSVYGHMQLGSMHLAVGQTVARGQLVGRVGDTGESTGAHLHFGILDASGTPIDSLAWITAHANAAYAPAG